MGVPQSLQVKSEKVMLDAANTGELCHVLIRAPYMVPVNVILDTSTFLTSFSSGNLPRLPILQYHHWIEELRKGRTSII